MIDKEKATVTMSLKDYEHLADAERCLLKYLDMFERSYGAGNGEAVMTDELRQIIEEIHC